MLSLQPIKTSDPNYAFMEKLLIESFPADEYRPLGQLREYTDNQSRFVNNVILDGDQAIGLFTYWNFDTFYYAEHFAIDPQERSHGYGSRTLEYVCTALRLPIVLEVEAPADAYSRRRIEFYKRNGFVFWTQAYQQPPYRPGDSFLPMHLMVYGDLNPEKDFERVKTTIHQKVYSYFATE